MMKVMDEKMMKKVKGGYTVYCPVCGYKSKTNWLRDLVYGKKASIAYDETWLEAAHFKVTKGYISGQAAHK